MTRCHQCRGWTPPRGRGRCSMMTPFPPAPPPTRPRAPPQPPIQRRATPRARRMRPVPAPQRDKNTTVKWLPMSKGSCAACRSLDWKAVPSPSMGRPVRTPSAGRPRTMSRARDGDRHHRHAPPTNIERGNVCIFSGSANLGALDPIDRYPPMRRVPPGRRKDGYPNG